MKNVEQIKTRALHMMAAGGFSITEDIAIAVDETLPFMGYTTQQNSKPLIVVAGWALTSDMVMGLVIHELSHVYRIETNHPSHNSSLHQAVLKKVFATRALHPFQREILHNAINIIQDLYADDISFAIFNKQLQLKDINEFFLGWIKEPIPHPTTLEDRWKNAGSLLNAAFAQANLERHHVEDTEKKVNRAVKEFLSHSDKHLAEKFDYFSAMMVRFPENITDDAFKEVLAEYITAFLKLTESPGLIGKSTN